MTVWDELAARGLTSQCTGEDVVRDQINRGEAVFYIGFDPTAESLHVGGFLQLILMRHLQRAGNKPIVLIGGGTAMIGDPTGRTDLRQMLTQEQIEKNAEKIKKQIARFIEFSDDPEDKNPESRKAFAVNNASWLLSLNYVKFLREIGIHFSVNRMLTAECFKARMERGLNFLEFNYMLMQGYDYYRLFEHYRCTLQCGGDDQWANILAGTELIRRKAGKDAHGLTIGLLLTSDGRKMGKTAKGAIWLDAEKTSPFEFFQYFRNTADEDVISFLKRLTFIPLPEIEAMSQWEGAKLNEAKERLAYEVCLLVHGKEAADEALRVSRELFSGGVSGDMPQTELTAEQVPVEGLSVLELMVLCGLAPSKGEARRLVLGGGVELDGERVDDVGLKLNREALSAGVVIKKGKKVFHKAVLSA